MRCSARGNAPFFGASAEVCAETEKSRRNPSTRETVRYRSVGYIEERTVLLANYITENKCTVRDAAKAFGISKSTVHKDVTERLPKINGSLAELTRAVLQENKMERHIRGGIATREKYLREHERKNDR